MKCKTCAREAFKSGFCQLHFKAYTNIMKKYHLWNVALKISWKEYLNEIVQNPLTGEWAKEVASYLISSEGMRYAKEG